MNPAYDTRLTSAIASEAITLSRLVADHTPGDTAALNRILVTAECIESRLTSLISRTRLALGISESKTPAGH